MFNKFRIKECKMNKKWISFFLIGLAFFVLSCSEESSPSKVNGAFNAGDSDLTADFTSNIEMLVGTYTLTGFRIITNDGGVYTEDSPGVSATGTMLITADATIVQNLVVNGTPMSFSVDILEFETSTRIRVSDGMRSYSIDIALKGSSLVTFTDGVELGLNYAETDYWTKTSDEVLSKKSSLFDSKQSGIGVAVGALSP
jgi:hypothetical protein